MKQNRELDDVLMEQQCALIDIIGLEEVANSSVKMAFAAMMALTMEELDIKDGEHMGRSDEIFDGAKEKMDTVVEWIRLQKEISQKEDESALSGKSSLV